jgi:hypothetical protein
VTKVKMQEFRLFHHFWADNAEGTSVREPGETAAVLVLRQHIVKLLSERHLTYIHGLPVAWLRGDRGEVSVAMINVGLGHFDDLDCPWGDGESERVHLSLRVSWFLRCLLRTVKRIIAVTDLTGFPDIFTSLSNLRDGFIDVVSLCSHAHEGGYGSAFVVHLVSCISLRHKICFDAKERPANKYIEAGGTNSPCVNFLGVVCKKRIHPSTFVGKICVPSQSSVDFTRAGKLLAWLSSFSERRNSLISTDFTNETKKGKGYIITVDE